MPWTAGDASSHTKKANTEAKKKKWAKIANRALTTCLADGGNQGDCEASAIRIANSQMSEEIMKVQKGALLLTELNAVTFKEEDGEPKLSMVVYSGGVIAEHFYWDNLIIDLEGMKFEKSKFPILEDHRDSKKIAFTKRKPDISTGKIVIESPNVQFVDTPESLEFRKLSKAGFPYEASVYAIPTEIERIAEGEVGKANGIKMKGPGTIWRKSTFREASVVVHGYDRNTKSQAFNEEIELDVLDINPEPDNTIPEEVNNNMDLAELKEKYPNLFTEIEDGVSTKLSKERKGLETEIVGLKQTEAELTEKLKVADDKLTENEDKVTKLEKKDVIRTERELLAEAGKVWDTKLSASDIPERLHEKVRNQVSHHKFVKEDILDVVAFSKAIDEEIKDWTDRGVSTKTAILGFSPPSDPEKQGEEEEETRENLAALNTMRESKGMDALTEMPA